MKVWVHYLHDEGKFEFIRNKEELWKFTGGYAKIDIPEELIDEYEKAWEAMNNLTNKVRRLVEGGDMYDYSGNIVEIGR